MKRIVLLLWLLSCKQQTPYYHPIIYSPSIACTEDSIRDTRIIDSFIALQVKATSVKEWNRLNDSIHAVAKRAYNNLGKGDPFPKEKQVTDKDGTIKWIKK